MLNGYGSTILEGAWLTLLLALSSMSMAILLGLVGAAFRLSPVRWLAIMGMPMPPWSAAFPTWC